MSMIDAVNLSQALIRCPSVTPKEAGALNLLENTLKSLEFNCQRLPFSEPGTPDVDNLFARFGNGSPNLCFAGHTDVVPVGNPNDWSKNPFGGEIHKNILYGRGAADMKCAIACFTSAASRFIYRHGKKFNGSISFLITGDEEGPAINGTSKVLKWISEQGESIDACIVGEPTNVKAIGDTIKIGRRGSINGQIAIHGNQGHVAYPHLSKNPVPAMLKILSTLDALVLDSGSKHFPPSNLEITTIDVGNSTTNLIPARVSAGFNIRFNDLHTGISLEKKINDIVVAIATETETTHNLEFSITGEAFLTPPGPLSEIIQFAAEKITGNTPKLSTTGGTSDARFIKNFCPVVEFGLTNASAHKVDECATLHDIKALSDIYETVLEAFFYDKWTPKNKVA